MRKSLAIFLFVAAGIAAVANPQHSRASDIVYWDDNESGLIHSSQSSLFPSGSTATSDSGLAVDSLGNIYELQGGALAKIAPDGSSFKNLAAPGANSLAVSPAGQVYVSNGARIETVSQAGVVSPFYTAPNAVLATDRAGDVFAASSSSGITTVTEITPSGAATTFGTLSVPAGVRGLDSIAVDPSGNVFVNYLGVSFGGEIYKMAPGGSSTQFYYSPASITEGLAAGNNGDIYTDLVKIDPTGAATATAFGANFGIAVLPTPGQSTATVPPLDGAQATFGVVTTPGTFTSTFSEAATPAALQAALGAQAAGQINFQVPGSTTQLWDLAYSGTFTGDAFVTVHFDSSLIGNTPLSELYIEHYVNGQWVTPANQVVDTVNDTITFAADSFSPFMLAVATPEPSSVVLLALGAIGLGATALCQRMRKQAA